MLTWTSWSYAPRISYYFYFVFTGKGFLDDIMGGRCTEDVYQPGNLISDVIDGSKRLFDGMFFWGLPQIKDEVHLSLQVNTDGVSIFKSSSSGVWRIYAVINELHPKKR